MQQNKIISSGKNPEERVRSNLLSGVKCRDGRERSLKMRVEAKADLTELILLIYKYSTT